MTQKETQDMNYLERNIEAVKNLKQTIENDARTYIQNALSSRGIKEIRAWELQDTLEEMGIEISRPNIGPVFESLGSIDVSTLDSIELGPAKQVEISHGSEGDNNLCYIDDLTVEEIGSVLEYLNAVLSLVDERKLKLSDGCLNETMLQP